MKQTDPQMRLRLPPDVKSWVEVQAERNLRSLNAEVVAALKEKMATTGSKFGDQNPVDAGNNTHQEMNDAAAT